MNYKELLDEFTPRYINNDDEYKDHVTVLDDMLDILYDRDWTTDERDYTNLIGLVIEHYEDTVYGDEMELKSIQLFKAEIEHRYYNFIYRLKNWNK